MDRRGVTSSPLRTDPDAHLDADLDLDEPTPQPSTAQPSTAQPPSPQPSTVTTAGAPAELAFRTEHWGRPLAVVVIGMFMTVLDTSIINVAIPTMEREFSATSDDIEWVATAYALGLGIMVPTSAWLGERFGLRRLYLSSLVLFTAFSALCGLADSLDVMIFFRALQAIPAAVMPATCLTILYRMVPPNKLGAAMGLYGFGMVLAPGIGPGLGGYLVEYVNWRLIFYINIPVGIIGIVAALVVLPNFPAGRGGRFDLPGFLFISSGLFVILLALSQGSAWGWTSYPVLILLAAGVNLLLLFVSRELAVPEPLLDVRVLTNWAFVNSLLLIAILTMGMFAVLFFVPQFLQNNQRITPLNSGLVVLPQALVMALVMPIAGRLYDRYGVRWLAVIGLLISVVGSYLMIGINMNTSRTEIVIWTALRALGLALCFMPIMTAGLSALPAHLGHHGSALNTLFQRVSSAFGLAGITALLTWDRAQLQADRYSLLPAIGVTMDPTIQHMHQGAPNTSGGLLEFWREIQDEVFARSYSNAFMVVTALTAVGVPLAILLRTRKQGTVANAEPVEL